MASVETPPWVESLVTIAKRFRDGRKTIRRLFEEASPNLSDRSSFEMVVEQRLRRDAGLVEAWQGYSRDKRTSPSPYLEGVEVGFYDRGRRDVVAHGDDVSACADFLFREASWVLKGRREHSPKPPRRMPEDPTEHFVLLGMRVVVRAEGNNWWADLYRGERLIAARYGKGNDPEAALARARERYLQEQQPS